MKPSAIPPSEWAEQSDTALAALHGGTRQKYSEYRKAHGLPASPIGHGGRRSCNVTVSIAKAPYVRIIAKMPVETLQMLAK